MEQKLFSFGNEANFTWADDDDGWWGKKNKKNVCTTCVNNRESSLSVNEREIRLHQMKEVSLVDYQIALIFLHVNGCGFFACKMKVSCLHPRKAHSIAVCASHI
jgi:hypothetical protein